MMKIMKKFNLMNLSVIMAIILTIGSWLFIFIWEDADISSFFSSKNLNYTKEFLGEMFGVNNDNPAFLNLESWKSALKLTYETFVMSVMAIGFATMGMFLTVIVGARNTADGSLTLKKTWYSGILFGLVRVLYIFSRAIPELVWAMIIVFIFKPGILPGAIALALHNFGILGKLCAETIEDLDLRPIRNLSSSGASAGQILVYGVLPTVMPKFITYILYRWEVIIRTTIVVGFVGAGGLGQEFKLSMSWFHYSEITLLLVCYLLLVGVADVVSEGFRKVVG